MIPRRAPSCTLPKADHVFPLFQCLLATCMYERAYGSTITVDDNRIDPLCKHVFPPEVAPQLLHWIAMEGQFCCELLLVSSELRLSTAAGASGGAKCSFPSSFPVPPLSAVPNSASTVPNSTFALSTLDESQARLGLRLLPRRQQTKLFSKA